MAPVTLDMHQAAPPPIFVAFDTETTGLSPIEDRVVEIAGAAFGPDGSPLGCFEQLVDPGIPIPEALTQIHGITDAMVQGKPRIEQVLPEFLRFAGDAVLVAHNAPYDVSMLMVTLLKMGAVPTPGNLVLDTCTLARAAFPGARDYRLGTIAEHLGIARGRAHRALADVEACREVFLRVLSSCPAPASLDELVRMNTRELRLGLAVDLLASTACSGTIHLEQALKSASAVMICYLRGTKGAGPRPVTPITLMARGKSLYLVAHCHLDRRLKQFRMDRISEVHPQRNC